MTMTDTTDESDLPEKHNKKTVFDALAEAGIHTVHVAFDGYGDSGQIEGINGFDASANEIPLPDSRKVTLILSEGEDAPADTTLRDAIETLAYRCLELSQPGWENDDGAYGTFVFDVADRTITLEHNARFTDVVTSQHRF
jgi:hypothetical protein